MDKKIQLKLNEYEPIPSSLCDPDKITASRNELVVDLAKLYHHYYLDTYGRAPPNPDAAQFEHVRFLSPEASFRFLGDGVGASTQARRSKSSELGQAFCRWFLHDHLDITYFAHISELIDRQNVRAIEGCRIERTGNGDTPDYLCADSTSVYLAEAKGRYSSISFKAKQFAEWRAQFTRVRVLNSSGVPQAIKGHIVATRFATEVDSERIKSTLYAEDPQSPGDQFLSGDLARNLASAVIGVHYARIAEKLNQPLLAAALLNGVPLPEEILVPIILWRLQLDPLKHRLFVGGYFPGPSGTPAFEIHDGRLQTQRNDPLRLDQSSGTFVGVDADVFRAVVSSCRSTGVIGTQLPKLESVERIYSAISMLRDGSVLGPIEFFTPVNGEVL